jgi:hypothetical protein
MADCAMSVSTNTCSPTSRRRARSSKNGGSTTTPTDRTRASTGSHRPSSQHAPHRGITGTDSPYKRGQVGEQVTPGPIDQGIQVIQAGLWAGLREWCHITQQRLTTDSDLTKAILSQFRAANALGRPRVGAVNTVMIDWLERCKDHGWELVTDKIPLLDAVENKLRSQPGTKLDT